MTREERLGLWIIAAFCLAGAAFYGTAIGPGYIRLVQTGTAGARTPSSIPSAQPGVDHAVRPRFGAVSGRLLDRRTRAPMPDGSIEVLGLAHVAAPHIRQSPDGSFQITGLPLEKGFELIFSHTGYSTQRLRRRLDLDGDHDIGLIELERFVLVEGRVKDRLGQGVAGVRVSWYTPLPRFSTLDPSGRAMALATLLTQTVTPVRQVFTDRSGRFSFGEAPPGPLDLTAAAPGFSTTLARGLDLRHRTARRVIELELRQGAVLEGTLRDAHDRPLPGATLVAVAQHSKHMWRRAATDRLGRFRFEDLPWGSWALGALHEDCVPTDLGDVEVPGPPVEISMERSLRHLRVEGSVPAGWWLDLLSREETGHLSRLHWTPRDPREQQLALDTAAAVLVWGAAGTIPDVAPLEAGNRSISVPGPDAEDLQTREGRIVDAVSGHALTGATIHPVIDGRPLAAVARSDEDGRFALRGPSNDSAGASSLLVLLRGYEPLRIEWPAADPPAKLSLSPVRSLKVRVVRADGRPEPHGRLQVVPARTSRILEPLRRFAPRMLETETDPEGNASVAAPPGGLPWRLIVRGENGLGVVDPEAIDSHLRSGEPLVVSLPTSARLLGTARDPQGTPLADVMLIISLPETYASALLDLEPPDQLTAVTGADGTFELGPLPPDEPLKLEARHGTLEASRPIPPLEPASRVISFDINLDEEGS